MKRFCFGAKCGGWRRAAVCWFWLAMAVPGFGASVQVASLITSDTAGVPVDNLPGKIYTHDLVPATALTFSAIVSGFPEKDPATLVSLLEDGVVVRVVSVSGGIENGSVEDIDYTPTSAGAKTFVVSATNGATTANSASIRVNVYGISIAQPEDGASAPAGSDLFIRGDALLRNGVVATVQFYVDGTLVGIDASAPYAVAWRPTTTGTHSLTAMLTASSGATDNSPAVSFTVIPAVNNGTLTVNLTSPTSGATVAAGTTVTVAADAKLTASSGTVSQVQFYLNGALLGAPVTSFPYATTWTPAVAGNYVLTAIATDDKNNARASSGAVVTVTGNVPTVVLTHPANNAIVMAGGGVSVTAVPSGQDGSAATVSAVDFFVDGNAIGSATAVPFTVVWSPIQPRATPYTLTARVTATNGAQASSEPALVTVISASTPPTVTLSTSNGTAPVPAGKAVTLTAVAADQSGSAATVASVDFFVEGILIGSSTTAPYSETWTPVVARTEPYALQARVNLKNGQSAFSAPVLVQVVVNAAPTVKISSPIDGQTFTLGSAIALAAIAGDSDGTIARVQFYANNAATGTAVTTAPFQGTFVPTLTGQFTLTARATDDTGNSTYSAPITITVKEPVGQSPTAFIGILPDDASFTIQKLFTAGSLLSVGVSASDPDGTVARVTLFYDGARLATFVQPPYATTLQLPSSADLFTDHTISAIVEDDDGNQANAAETITVVSSSRSLPVVSLISPTEGKVFNYGTAISVEAQLAGSVANVTGVVFSENGVEIQTATSPPYKIAYVPGNSGPKSLTAIAYYNWTWTIESGSGDAVVRSSYNIVTTAGTTVNFTVKDFSPTSDAESFVSQSYQDLRLRAATTAEIAQGATALGGGALTRAQLAANLVNGADFSDGFTALAAAWIVTGQWPTYDNYASGVATIRASDLTAQCGVLLASNEYVAAYGPTPTVTSLTGANSYANLEAFAKQLYQNAYGRNPSLAEIQAVANAPSTVSQAGGITVVGLNQFLAEFVTKNSATIAARVRAAGLYIGLWRRQPTSAEVATLAAQSAGVAADGLLADPRYAARFLAVSRQPQSLTLADGASGLLRVEVSGTPPFGYQWYRNGAIVPGGTRATLTLRNASAATAGRYYVVVTSTTSRVVSSSATVTVATGASRLTNLSSRAYAGPGDDALIAGFVVGGTGAKTLLLRDVGPGLSGQGVAGVLNDPKLELHSTTAILGTNDDWGSVDAGALEATAARVGAFALGRGSKDAALLRDLSGGVYSLVANNATGGPGVALAEIYDAGAASDATRLVNLSSRARVGTGEQAMFAGFVVSGNVSKRVLIRAVGPGLLAQGVQNPLLHPQLTLTTAGGAIATNDNWSASTDAAAIATVGAQVGAFPLVAGSLDAAVLMSLPPGVYSVVVSGVGGTSGIALVEVYDADP